MTNEEMIILKSCLRYMYKEILTDTVINYKLDESGPLESLRRIILNYHSGFFDSKERSSYIEGNYSHVKIINTMRKLIEKADVCDESFDGYMLI